MKSNPSVLQPKHCKPRQSLCLFSFVVILNQMFATCSSILSCNGTALNACKMLRETEQGSRSIHKTSQWLFRGSPEGHLW